jgi:hypothetical protein
MNRLPLTLNEAKSLKPGMVLNIMNEHSCEFLRNADGTRAHFKVTSVKTWKRTPEKVEVKVQRGLFEFHTLKQYHFTQPNTSDSGIVYIQPMEVYE